MLYWTPVRSAISYAFRNPKSYFPGYCIINIWCYIILVLISKINPWISVIKLRNSVCQFESFISCYSYCSSFIFTSLFRYTQYWRFMWTSCSCTPCTLLTGSSSLQCSRAPDGYCRVGHMILLCLFLVTCLYCLPLLTWFFPSVRDSWLWKLHFLLTSIIFFLSSFFSLPTFS